MTESQIQQMIIEYCDWYGIRIFAIPNGGKRSPKEAYFLKKSGVKAGVPDMCIPIPKGKYHGLYIELKVGKNKPSENQKQWIEFLNKQGYKAVVCYGFDESIATINNYLRGNYDIQN